MVPENLSLRTWLPLILRCTVACSSLKRMSLAGKLVLNSGGFGDEGEVLGFVCDLRVVSGQLD